MSASAWKVVTDAARSAASACRLALVDGPAPGTIGVVGPDGTWLAGPAIGAAPAALADLGRLALSDGQPRVQRLESMHGLTVFADPFLPLPRLIIVGGGHIGLALAPAALAAGFSVMVVDDRPEFAAADRFPGAEVLCAHPVDGLTRLQPGAADFIVIATRSHALDYLAAETALQWPVPYVGMIGSRRKAELMRQSLREGGVTPEGLMRLHLPVGLSIEAESPAEIAVSIVAELIAVRRSEPIAAGDPETLRVWLALAEGLGRGEPCALATVVQVKGSTPRSAGARMLIWADGRYIGTIGGGRREAEIARQGRDCIQSKQAFMYRADYVEEQDALCGGAALILVEPVR